jgi:hypothetical protein
MQLTASVTKGTRTGLKVLWELAKVIVPAMVIVNVLDQVGVLPYLGRLLAPLMGIFGLPGEGALVLLTANFVSYYAGLAIIIALHLTWKHVTILAVMMSICHGAIYETPMVAKAGARSSWVLVSRFLAMIVAGLLLNWLLP